MKTAGLLFLLSIATTVHAADKGEAAILELGGATGWNVKGGGTSFGPDLAVEFTPIENWLEIEAGVTPLFQRHQSTEWNTDLLFKKPWTLSQKCEFMLGAGPDWVHTKQPGARVNSVSAEIAGDFMFWPGARHRFGWFVEPEFDYNFMRGHEKSFGVSFGLLIVIP